MTLNSRALWLVESLLTHAHDRRVHSLPIEKGGRVVDCGVNTLGGFEAGIFLARICMADLATVSVVMGEVAGKGCPIVHVATDQPVTACLGSQYAGWAISSDSYFAMGSGPMRAAHAKEPIFGEIGVREDVPAVVGVLEGRTLPTADIMAKVAEACRVPTSGVTLLIAPTASIAGGLQVVARSVETALHKLHELKFDVKRVVSATGSAPLPPVAKHDMAAIGRTNDAILYGGRVVLQVTGDDESLAEIGPKVPSSASPDHGEPFAAIFKRYNHDFYAVDKMLFSPAEVVFQNIQTGRTHAFGKLAPEVLAASFGY